MITQLNSGISKQDNSFISFTEFFKVQNLLSKEFDIIFKGKVLTLKGRKDGKFVASGSGDGSIKIFNLQTFQEMLLKKFTRV